MLEHWLQANRDRLKEWLELVGYDYRHWTRPVMYERCAELITALDPPRLDVLEISAGWYFQGFPFRSFRSADYPDYDVCREALPQQFDLIIADQVFEHLLWPYRAARHVCEMVKPGGHFLVTTPFLIRRHEIPFDCTRWTETGMKHFLIEAGFEGDSMITGSWGNRACVKANFKKWARRGWFGSLKNEPDFPVVVWALARRAAA
ncbi:MAG: methyltransferase domain-containing protein [Roseateles sp.]|uniref:methyltransferase domain-containing protein n=1 Tax=Roseateles sp. TaxID=1971397 RepID=UPI0039E7488E